MQLESLRTSDLYLAAYIHCLMAPTMRDLEYAGRQASFIFAPNSKEEADQLQQLRRGWVNGTGMVAAVRYAQSVKMLKGLVHNQ